MKRNSQHHLNFYTETLIDETERFVPQDGVQNENFQGILEAKNRELDSLHRELAMHRQRERLAEAKKNTGT